MDPFLLQDRLFQRLAPLLGPDRAYAVCERAAILEHDGRLERGRAEIAALIPWGRQSELIMTARVDDLKGTT